MRNVIAHSILVHMYCHGLFYHQSKKLKVNSEELDVYFDQFGKGNPFLAKNYLNIIVFDSVQIAITISKIHENKCIYLLTI